MSLALFPSILCGTDHGPSGVAARRQAAWVAGEHGTVELVPAGELMACGPEELAQRCLGHDLLVLGSESEAHALFAHAGTPVLLARWCLHGHDLTDEILVAVGGHPGCERAAVLAADLARRYRGSVSVVAVHEHSRELRRALAATSRIILCGAGHVPRVLGEPAPPEIAVPEAANEIGATMLVLGIGEDAWDAEVARTIARGVACSVLAIPEPRPLRRRFTPSVSRRALLPA